MGDYVECHYIEKTVLKLKISCVLEIELCVINLKYKRKVKVPNFHLLVMISESSISGHMTRDFLRAFVFKIKKSMEDPNCIVFP